MRTSRAQLPAEDRKREFEKLWKTLKEEPPGPIVGVRTHVADGSTKKRKAS